MTSESHGLLGMIVGALILWLIFVVMPIVISGLFDDSPPPPANFVDLSKGVSPDTRQAHENIIQAASITEQRRYGRGGKYERDVIITIDRLPEDGLGYEIREYQRWVIEHGPENKVFSRTEKHR